MYRTIGKQGALLLSGILILHGCSAPPNVEPFGVRSVDGTDSPGDAILRWNAVALQADLEDHSGTYGAAQNGGPTRSSRALAIIHLAMYDAVNAVDGSCQPYIPVKLPPHVTQKASVEAAVATAAHDTLCVLYSNQKTAFDEALQKYLAKLPDTGLDAGIKVGQVAAANILAKRADDGSDQGQTPIYPGTGPTTEQGEHQPDPLNPDQGLLGPGWGNVQTFSGIDVKAASVRADSPPPIWHPRYTKDFLDVYHYGGDGIHTPTKRTEEQTQIGLFWAYDGTPQLGTPPRFFNQIVRKIAKQQGNSLAQNARLFALTNLAMADAGIACWDSKYYYNLWRPIIGIRQADDVFNCELIHNTAWEPLGAPLSNSIGPNFTPPFPTYPSGHATFAGALFRTLRNFYGSDDYAFRMRSDELRDTTTDNQGNPRPNVTRSFTSFSQAAAENARSRIYLGVHWQFDGDAGVKQGTTIADYICNNVMRPTH